MDNCMNCAQLREALEDANTINSLMGDVVNNCNIARLGVIAELCEQCGHNDLADELDRIHSSMVRAIEYVMREVHGAKTEVAALVDSGEGEERVKPRRRMPCGIGNRIPECLGSAVSGPAGCTCPDPEPQAPATKHGCGTCGGSGYVRDESKPPGEQALPCPDCGGE